MLHVAMSSARKECITSDELQRTVSDDGLLIEHL